MTSFDQYLFGRDETCETWTGEGPPEEPLPWGFRWVSIDPANVTPIDLGSGKYATYQAFLDRYSIRQTSHTHVSFIWPDGELSVIVIPEWDVLPLPAPRVDGIYSLWFPRPFMRIWTGRFTVRIGRRGAWDRMFGLPAVERNLGGMVGNEPLCPSHGEPLPGGVCRKCSRRSRNDW